MSWEPYQPSDQSPWDWRRVVHLHRRAGLGASWDQVRRDMQSTPGVVIDRMLGHRAEDENSQFEETSNTLAEAAVQSGDPLRLKAWWLFRFLFSPQPLREKLTLLWHNHFATSNLKVQNLGFMQHQNDLLRTHCMGHFRDLLVAVIKHPAMLIWLDAGENRKGNPNENLARELLELFTVGIGSYTEDDVKNAARALTGWTVRRDRLFWNAAAHDDGTKSILGTTQPFCGDALLNLLLDHAATSRRIAWRLCDLLLGEGVASQPDLETLATGLSERELNIGWAVETILRSQLFFSEANICSRISSPIEFVIGAIRSLELLTPPPSTLLLADWTARLGQDLFFPPNVGGWTGGRAWLDSRKIIGRSNFAAALSAGDLHVHQQTSFQSLVDHHDLATDSADFFHKLLCGSALANRSAVQVAPGKLDSVSREREISSIVARVLSLPEAFLV